MSLGVAVVVVVVVGSEFEGPVGADMTASLGWEVGGGVGREAQCRTGLVGEIRYDYLPTYLPLTLYTLLCSVYRIVS